MVLILLVVYMIMIITIVTLVHHLASCQFFNDIILQRFKIEIMLFPLNK